MREPKKRGLSMNDLAPIMKVFDDLENNEMQEFYDNFSNLYPEFAKELMTELEEKVFAKVADELDWRRQKEICFFSPENELKIKTTIKQSIWKVIVEDLEDYGF